ncbi:hypothetical protein MmiHf6_02450 [Methanimicrococcus hongohii]|uniref:Uncharacterized protein n=1 Tax=Methanimicrococcus hongohii TaxID=3028295 RepID=A0AA96V7I8_9EURY|nr:hypothetical protein [Methanimicrococcus sp. Hf6]WNY22951.1 hypothetical protein MmiHf6_02450 [Methanimicrococcus sp. Hf6]
MQNETQIEIPFPLVINNFFAKYSATEKPSGLGYMILKMIGSDGVSKEMTFREIVKEFGLPEDLFPILIKELEVLCSKKMIQFDGLIELDSQISFITFTKLGNEAFSKGVISKSPKDFTGDLFFAPGKKDKLYRSSSNFKSFSGEINVNLFNQIHNIDALDLEDYLKSHKKDYNINKEDDIFDFQLNPFEISIYGQNVKLIFDQTNAMFSFSEGDMDINFIKGHYPSGYIADQLNPFIFETSSNDISITKWDTSDIPWNKYEYVLPSDFKILEFDLCLFNTEYCEVNIEHLHAPFCLQKFDSHAIVISSTGSFAHRFIRGKVGLKGFDGQRECNLVIRRSLLPEEKDNCLKEAVKSINQNETDSFLKCIQICRQMSDSEIEIKDFLTSYLENASIEKYSLTAKELKRFEKEKWHKKLPEIIEQSIVENTDLLKDWRSLVDLLLLLASEKVVSGWYAVIPKLFSSNSSLNLEVADYCLDKNFDKKTILRSSGILTPMIRSIQNNNKIDGNSRFFTNASNIRYNLTELKKLTEILSVSEYSFDIDLIDEEKRTKIIKHVSTLDSLFKNFLFDAESSNILKSSDQVDLENIKKLVDIFKDISITLKSMDKTVSLKDLSKERNSRLVGIGLGVKLEEIFKSMGFVGTLNEMISNAYDKELISKSDFEIFGKIREFRNQCAHDLIVPNIDGKQKEKWISSVSRLDLSSAVVQK